MPQSLSRRQLIPIRRFRETVTVIGFVFAVVIPMLATIILLPQNSAWQKEYNANHTGNNSLKGSVVRALRAAKLLSFDFGQFLAMRQQFLLWNGKVKVDYLHTTTTSQAVLGKNRWLYLSSDNTIEDYRHLNPLPSADIQVVKNYLENAHARLSRQGIDFLVVVPPNKQTIYPENLPDAFRPVDGITHFEQLQQAMKESPVHLLDLAPVLRKEKAKGYDVFLKTDSHWSDTGAFNAYSATCEQLKQWFPKIRPLTAEDLKTSPAVLTETDLPAMMGLEQSYPEHAVRLRPIHEQSSPTNFKVLGESNPLYRRESTSRQPEGEINRVLIFCDSFSADTQYSAFLSRHFEEARWMWVKGHTYLDFDLIEKTKPDLVILERAERLITQSPDSHQ